MPQEHEPKILGLPRNIFLLGIVSMVNDLSSQMVQSVMPVFITQVLGAPVVVVGIIEGVADAVASILKIVFGWISDQLNRRKLFAVTGYVLSLVTRPLLTLVTGWGQVFSLRVIDRVGKGMRDAPRDALIGESTSPETISRSFGYHRMMDAIGGTAGPLIAFAFLPLVYYSYHSIFLIAFVLGLFAVFMFLFVKEVRRPETIAAPKFDLSLLRNNRRFVVFLISVFVFGLGALPLPLIVLRAPEVGLGAASATFFYFVSYFAFVLASIPFGQFADSFGKRKIVSIGFMFALAAYALLITANGFWSLLIPFIFIGFFNGATDGIQRAMVARLVGPEIRATGQGFLNASIGISALLAGVIGGGLWTYVSSQAAFVYAATMSFAGLVLFLTLMNVSFRE